MSTPITRATLRFSNRKQECELFRKILCHETSLRGLVIHSGGEGGLGKSTLLKMFENECKTSDLPVSITPLYFNADRLINWQNILDRTVDVIGKEHFQDYIQLRARYGVATERRPGTLSADLPPTSVHHEVHFHGSVYGPLHTGSGDIEIEKSASAMSGFGSLPAGDFSAKPPLNPEEIRAHLTQVFLQALNSIPEPLQVVWLVDTAEKLDDITENWLIEMFWQIVEGKTGRLVLVVAGRERLRYEPHWIERIAEMPISHFNEEIVAEILQEIWPDYDMVPLRMAASGLVEKSGGRPLEVIMQIESYIGLGG